MAQNPTASVILGLKTNKYKGEIRYQLTGSFKNANQSFICNISCDDKGNPNIYQSDKDGTPLVFMNVTRFADNGQARKRKNEF